MSSTLLQSHLEVFNGCQSMQEFGEVFIEALPQHIGKLKIPGRTLIDNHRREPVMAQVTQTDDIQNAMLEENDMTCCRYPKCRPDVLHGF